MKKKIIAAAVTYAMGITQHAHGTDNVLATSNLALLTGNLGKPSSGVNPLRGQNNEQVEINPQDALFLGIEDGELIKVASRRGEVIARAKVTNVSPPGVVSMTFHFAESPTNVLTSPAIDPVAKIPETKVCAVRIEKR